MLQFYELKNKFFHNTEVLWCHVIVNLRLRFELYILRMFFYINARSETYLSFTRGSLCIPRYARQLNLYIITL